MAIAWLVLRTADVRGMPAGGLHLGRPKQKQRPSCYFVAPFLTGKGWRRHFLKSSGVGSRPLLSTMGTSMCIALKAPSLALRPHERLFRKTTKSALKALTDSLREFGTLRRFFWVWAIERLVVRDAQLELWLDFTLSARVIDVPFLMSDYKYFISASMFFIF